MYQVWFHPGMAEKPEYELCMRVEDVNLPKTGVFGISAATGGLAGQSCKLAPVFKSVGSKWILGGLATVET